MHVLLALMHIIDEKLHLHGSNTCLSFSQSILDMFNEGRNAEIQGITNQIEELKKIEYMSTVRKDVIGIYRVRKSL